MEDFVLGLDLGITSIGWCIMNSKRNRLIDMGVHLFEEATPAAKARKNRSARRTLRRKQWRKQQLKDAFVDFGLLTETEIKQEGFLSFTTNNSAIPHPSDETIYHLRKHALSEMVSIRELFLALYNICGTRGHFLMETVNFESNEPISYAMFQERFFETCEPFVIFNDQAAFEKNILKKLFEEDHIAKKDLNQLLKTGYGIDEESDKALKQILYLLNGFKANLSEIDESVVLPDKDEKLNMISLIQEDETNDFLASIVELHDMIVISKILKDHHYICEVAVEKLEDVKEIYKLEKTDPDTYEAKKKEIQSKMNVKQPNNKLRVIKNMENKYPNGLYVKEARAILKCQQIYYPDLITNEFIEVCISILKARIPYYIGPLGKDAKKAKNAWTNKKGNFKYSYAYSEDKLEAVKPIESIKAWKKAMISHCTYLPEEYALPKGSFIAETFSILNELNILEAINQNEDTYYLTRQDKIKVFDELFLKQKSVTYQDICDLLQLKSFGPRKKTGKQQFKNQYTLYHSIQSYLPKLHINSITEIFTNSDKINTLEDMILNINLFNEEASKRKYFKDVMHNDEETAKKLARLKSNKFFALSKKFIMDTEINEDGQSLLDAMFNDNKSDYMNEQMTLITYAKDCNGNPINFDANKYISKLKNNPHLSIDLLIDNGKPFIPISRPVIRALNECFKLYEEIINTYGIPKRVVIETAKDLKDSTRQGEIPAKHFDKMKDYYEYLINQTKQSKYKLYRNNKLADWETISAYLTSNRKKVELYIRQNGRDMISGDPINLDCLQDYEMDHILPRGFSDNSMDNLMLIHKNYNAQKQDRVPLEYIEDCFGDIKNRNGHIITSSDFMGRVHELFDLQLISEKKVKQLSLRSTEEAMGFINRNLVDTRYIIKELTAILKAYHAVNHYDTHIVSLKGAFTAVYRYALEFQKNRDIGVQHHAHDAAILCIADQILSTYYPNYDSGGNIKAYQEFIESIKDKNKGLKSFILFGYEKAFGGRPYDNGSIVSQVKALVPLYSIKSEKNYKGKFFDDTILKQDKASKDDPASKEIPVTENKPVSTKNPLSLLGINNRLHIFSGINCVAVDFYKYTNRKGEKKHVAIHIPKVIVDEQGNINKQKYITLVRDYYQETELLDENENIKEYYFRMRVFKNDLIYDTNHKVIQKFNIGSIANKGLELKHIYNFSYDELYNKVLFIRRSMIDHFDLKINKINPEGKKHFKDINTQEAIDFCIDELMEIDNKERYKKAITEILNKEEKTFQTFIEKVAFLDLIVNRNCTPPSITGRYLPVINTITNGMDKKDKEYKNAQYIKIKSSILGIRYYYNDKGTLIISGPRHASHKFSKIKKEAFSWHLGKTMVE